MRRSRNDGKPPKLDIRTVAAHAGVSIATVSRTINRIATVDPDMATRVWKAVEELNYFPNTQARALVSGRSKLLGLIVSEITNPFFPELIQEFETLAVASGYEILIGSTSYDLTRVESCVRRMLERKVDAVAIMTFGIEDLLLGRFVLGDIPVALIDAGPPMPRSSIIMVDYRQGIDEGLRHLAALGHRKIGFISGPLQLRSAESRRTAFLESMSEAGIPANLLWVIEGDHTLDGGRDAMVRLLKLADRPTAIMCSNDMTAIGVQHALFEANLRVPDDFSLIGFDDIHLAEYTIPPLTTVRMSCKDLARRAVSSLLRHLGGVEGDVAPHPRIATSLIIRQTTGVPRATPLSKRRPAQTSEAATVEYYPA